ncbi:hypothetical protein DIURU_003720 [Diutina rugosa]|uniref:Reverse transcriptase Ty1/copia-type domain-containing protein n=1 Tax=Diutina rugosa TaxID=5481 RepID=A0A642UKE7_DIURU|nr:uncharacterized protein DIURU_003720 [Diutina rugosa]KAA8900608.1 hypothetical protein DIURU_003720 [Diutina rugosa]
MMMKREQAALEKYNVLTNVGTVDPATAEGRRKLSLTARLCCQGEPKPNGEERYRITIEPGTQPRSTIDNTPFPLFDRNMMRFVLSYAVDHQFHIHHLEIEDGLKHPDIDAELYVYYSDYAYYNDFISPLRPEVVETGPVALVRVNKAIFGLAQSERLWYEYFARYLDKIGLETTDAATGVFIYYSQGATKLIVGIHGTQLFVAAKDSASYTWFVDQLKKQGFDVGEYGRPKQFMSIDFTYPSDGVIHLSDRTRVSNFIGEFGVDPSVGSRLEAPLPANFNWSRFDDKRKLCENMTADEIAKGKKWMTERLGALAELAKSSRHDIDEVVTKLSLFKDYPHLLLQRMVQRVMLYVAQTPDYGIDFKPINRRSKWSRTLNAKVGTFDVAGVVMASVYSAGKMWWMCEPIDETQPEIDTHVAILMAAMSWMMRSAVVLKFFDTGDVNATPSSDGRVRLTSGDLIKSISFDDFTSSDPKCVERFNLIVRSFKGLQWILRDIGE